MIRLIKWLLARLGFGSGDRPRGPHADPYAWKPVPRTRRPNDRAGAVAVAEPEDE
jgi:hypothetical protein